MSIVKNKIKLKFVDFWGNLNDLDNIFCQIISKKYDIEFSDDPDILFYSSYGLEHVNYNCIRIFFTGENDRPNYTFCDYAISFDHSINPKQYRFPLWAYYYWVYVKGVKIPKLDLPITDIELLQNWKLKTKFCCFIVSNPHAKIRNDFFEKLSHRKKVDSAGKYKNNIGYFLEGGTIEKLKFIKDYKFVISFENASSNGYTTEKILEPLLAGCIPIYWGDPMVAKDFNPKRFLDLANFKSQDDLIDAILNIDENDNLALEMLKNECFSNFNKSIEQYEYELSDFLFKITDNLATIKPIYKSKFNKVLYRIILKFNKYKNKILFRINKLSSKVNI